MAVITLWNSHIYDGCYNADTNQYDLYAKRIDKIPTFAVIQDQKRGLKWNCKLVKAKYLRKTHQWALTYEVL